MLDYQNEDESKDEMIQEYEIMLKMFQKYDDDKSELKHANPQPLEQMDVKDIAICVSRLKKELHELLCRILEIKSEKGLSVYMLEQRIKNKQ